MWIYIILCIVIIVLAIVFALFVIAKNKFQVSIIKINEAEENVGLLLKEKYENLVEVRKINKKKTKENAFEELDTIDIDNINNFELNTELHKYDNTILELVEFNKDINFTEKENETIDKLNNTNVECVAVMKYYNDNVTIYNELLNNFPANIIAKLKGYKEKKLYTNEKEEIFEILKK